MFHSIGNVVDWPAPCLANANRFRNVTKSSIVYGLLTPKSERFQPLVNLIKIDVEFAFVSAICWKLVQIFVGLPVITSLFPNLFHFFRHFDCFFFRSRKTSKRRLKWTSTPILMAVGLLTIISPTPLKPAQCYWHNPYGFQAFIDVDDLSIFDTFDFSIHRIS